MENARASGELQGLPASWLLVALAAALPLLEGALPKDADGTSVLPHQHNMDMVEADKENLPMRFMGCSTAFRTDKVCDRCMEQITERVFYHCSADCDVDFCSTCHDELQACLARFGLAGGAAAPAEHQALSELAMRRMLWAVHAVDELSRLVLMQGASERAELAQLLAFEWPLDLFSRLVQAVVDVCNGKMLYNCNQGAISTPVVRNESAGPSGTPQARYAQLPMRPIYTDKRFWCSVGLLEFLYACNGLSDRQLLDGHGTRGPRVLYQDFILQGIDKCKPAVEWQKWCQHSQAEALDVLRAPEVRVSPPFRTLVAHSHFLPISFRRQCLLHDLWGQIRLGSAGLPPPLRLRVEREPARLVEATIEAYMRCCPEHSGGPEAPAPEEWWRRGDRAPEQFRRQLDVAFGAEDGRGPGVRREFFQVAVRAFLASFFTPTERTRTYWFGDVDRPEGYFALGVLLGHAVLHDVLIPNAFPSTLFELLLRDLGSPKATGAPGLAELAAVSPAEADSLRCVLDHGGADIGAHFGDLGWERTGRLRGEDLSQATKELFVSVYIDWSLGEKIRRQFGPLSAGFRAVLGSSVMVQRMVDAPQLERIVCGGEVPVDVGALRRRAAAQGWEECERGYLNDFWDVVAGFDDAAKRRFVVFVTASDRVPLRGWEELRITVQKNGGGDERLPSAYTCFALLLLPLYTSIGVLRASLLQAIDNSEGFGLN